MDFPTLRYIVQFRPNCRFFGRTWGALTGICWQPPYRRNPVQKRVLWTATRKPFAATCPLEPFSPSEKEMVLRPRIVPGENPINGVLRRLVLYR
jgi:hypothetical protein